MIASLYFYKLEIFDEKTHDRVKFNDKKLPKDVRQLFLNFEEFVSKNPLQTEERSVRFTPNIPGGTDRLTTKFISGVVSYGQKGLASEIYNEKGELLFNRGVDHLETFPLLYSFWVDLDSSAAFIMHQAYQQRSCVSVINSNLRSYIQENLEGYQVSISVLSAASDELFEKMEIKNVSFYSSSKSNNADIARKLLGDEIGPANIEIVVKARKSKKLGFYKDIERVLPKDSLVSIGEDNFDRAVATVIINGKSRKVGLWNASRNFGNIDITEDVDVDENSVPIPYSVEKAAIEILKSLHADWGM